MNLDDAIEILTTTYLSLDAVAQGLYVNPKEVADALALATPDTAEFVALQVLAKYYPFTKQSKNTTNANTIQQ